MTHLPGPVHFTPSPGRICLVGAGPGTADLLTRRAAERLRWADIVFHDRLVDPEVLALVPAVTELVNVGKEVGRCHWPQSRINTAIVTAALCGKNVVRLKSGDPSIFGRAAEEIAAAQGHGIAVEVVPGITAASAAAASCLSPLTERGRFDQVTLLTATSLTGDLARGIAQSLRPGTRLAVYMGVHVARGLEDQLLRAGLPGGTRVILCEGVATRRERRLTCRLDALGDTVLRHKVKNPAILLVDAEAPAGALPQVAPSVTLQHGAAAL